MWAIEQFFLFKFDFYFYFQNQIVIWKKLFFLYRIQRKSVSIYSCLKNTQQTYRIRDIILHDATFFFNKTFFFIYNYCLSLVLLLLESLIF